MNPATPATDLFERYLQAIRKDLPPKRQDDIVAELRANLEAQREEREAELGRPLTEGEMIDWLKELGPPHQVAARYQPPRYLIGPAIFPVYTRVLRVVVTVASVVYVVMNISLAFAQTHGPGWIFDVVFNWPAFLVVPAAWTTIAFIVIEFLAQRYPEKCPDFLAWGPAWSPTGLPPLDKQPPVGSKPRTFTAAMAEFVIEFAALLWVLLIPHFPFLILGPGVVVLHALPLRFAPVVVWFYWAVVAFSIMQLLWHGYDLLYDRWRVRGPVQHVITKGIGIIPGAILLAAPGQIYLEAWPAGAVLPPGFNLATTNHWIYIGVTVIILISVFQFLWDLGKIISTARRNLSAAQL